MFFKRKKKEILIQSPLEGEILPLERVPDEVFSQKMLGDGFAVAPTNGTVVSPVDGEIVNVFPTKHAIGIKDTNGKEILIHVGLDTVNLQGEGFTSYVTDGQSVKKGQKLLEVDFAGIRDKVPSIITIVVMTNLAENEKVVLNEQGAQIVEA
ncbi:PTS glucose transporter subunit IIA [Robertmurraya kyonggiensis]|uniref:PTS glucose transporter subunit IIA n=1 Tax=Robertmurraya kyonggiensis TaxID=1037680 RepID=A0A4U1CXU7_9BACI|nr:PTS glucose transporter subunit IIA [Robertmurraya kyonggiensis]TKC14722.1 PTS glucose transporter subunit IIA [Robertmurraya kyonggiensis]